MTEETYTFGELISAGAISVTDGYRAKNSELGGAGLIFLRAGHVTDAHIDFDGVERFHEELTEKLKEKTSRVGDVIITTKGNSTGRTSFVDATMPTFVYSPHLSRWRVEDPNTIDSGFLRCWSRSPEFVNQMHGLAASTDMAPYLSLRDQQKLRITLPDINNQRAIGSVLGALDDKIEQSRRTGRALGALARATFKAWFVDFEPVKAKAAGRTSFPGMPPAAFAALPDRLTDSPLGPVPLGWEIARLDSLLTLHYGKALPKTKRVFGPIPVYGSGGVTGTHSQSLVDGPGIIVGRKGSVGTLYWEDGSFFPIDTTYYVEPVGEIGLHYLFELLQTFGLEKMNTDAAVPGLNRENVYRLEAIVPTSAVYCCFERYAETLRDMTSHLAVESSKLGNLRDYLLPRLLSGRARVRSSLIEVNA